jgi:hypothetical protein
MFSSYFDGLYVDAEEFSERVWYATSISDKMTTLVLARNKVTKIRNTKISEHIPRKKTRKIRTLQELIKNSAHSITY